jgi:hypothetical protein
MCSGPQVVTLWEPFLSAERTERTKRSAEGKDGECVSPSPFIYIKFMYFNIKDAFSVWFAMHLKTVYNRAKHRKEQRTLSYPDL